MKNFKEKLEIDMLKEMTYTDINKLLNELNTKNKELTEQLRLCGVGRSFCDDCDELVRDGDNICTPCYQKSL